MRVMKVNTAGPTAKNNKAVIPIISRNYSFLALVPEVGIEQGY